MNCAPAPDSEQAPDTGTAGDSDQTEAASDAEEAAAGFDIPDGKALFVFYNYTNVDWNLDVGPHLLQVPANQAGQEYAMGTVALDPGTYTWQAHSPGGGYYITDADGNTSFEITVEAGQVVEQSVQ
jgi:hypothetical protein